MRIGIYAFDGITMFHLAVPQMVFDEVTRQGLASWETFLFSDRKGSVSTAEGYRIEGVLGLTPAAQADVVVVPSWFDDGRDFGARAERVLVEAHARGATVVGLCLGALPVVESGLLEGRPAVTHWQAFDLLRARHPELTVDDSVLYIDHGDVLTSAGTASGLDACLHLVRTRLGAAAANQIARSLVIAPHREGGQAQYVERPLPREAGDDAISRTLQWAAEHLEEELTVTSLASVVHLSTRTFLREFRAVTGSTPAAWVRARRLDEARRLLETTSLPIERIAEACGMGSAVTLRQNFAAAYGTTPSGYRRQFGDRTGT
ncbi:GlxA family transcriptional regulator [Brachybacterium fresconis]|uniref:Transcriptional regulator GlxA family with amidase domain n=1 Tax=Brachybacterium fresconis TaxID=173363 RepID=A0ABS4YL78_9MICO|nr:transcriptional regulator GlxA family with amidase domain [Brachybacterium fresconis]